MANYQTIVSQKEGICENSQVVSALGNCLSKFLFCRKANDNRDNSGFERYGKSSIPDTGRKPNRRVRNNEIEIKYYVK